MFFRNNQHRCLHYKNIESHDRLDNHPGPQSSPKKPTERDQSALPEKNRHTNPAPEIENTDRQAHHKTITTTNEKQPLQHTDLHATKKALKSSIPISDASTELIEADARDLSKKL